MQASFRIISASVPDGCRAFPFGCDISLSLSVEGSDCQKIWAYIGDDSGVIIAREAGFYNTETGFFAGIALNSGSVSGRDGLFFCHFEFTDKTGKRYYTAFAADETCYVSDRFVNELQFTVFREIYRGPEWLSGGAVYQIFPDRFAKGGADCRREGLKYDCDWENGIPEYPVKGKKFLNNTHFGGTLWGAAERLGYLASLGVNCVYFNPLFEAASNHKYDTGDYLKVDRTFGGDEALAYFIEKAHSLGIAVVLDGVFNHVGDNSIYFNKYAKYPVIGAYQSKDSEYFNWFDFYDYPDGYAAWWGIKTLPRTVRCRSYRDFITGVVIPKYMAMGVDGWRLDVVDELESDFVDEIAAAVKKCKPDAILIGEVWEDASNKTSYGERKRYFRGAQLDSVMNYPLRNAVIDFVSGNGNKMFVDTVNALYAHYPVSKQKFLLNFLGSHDTERITTVLGGDSGPDAPNEVLASRRLSPERREEAKELLVSAYTLLAAMPGVPCIYYGDEIAMEGYHDPFNRRPFPEEGFNDPFSRRFAAINALRRKYKDCFTLPYFKCSPVGKNAVAITRGDGKRRLTVFAVFGEEYAVFEPAGDYFDIVAGKPFCGGKVAKNSVLLLISEEQNDR